MEPAGAFESERTFAEPFHFIALQLGHTITLWCTLETSTTNRLGISSSVSATEMGGG